MDVKITVKGLPELKAEMQRLSASAQTRLARNGSMAMARVVARYARLNAPVGETGDLKRSIKARRDPSRRSAPIAYANASVWYSHFPEFGTAHSAAHPYLRPGLDDHLPEVNAKLIENLGRGIEREVAKQFIAEDQGEP